MPSDGGSTLSGPIPGRLRPPQPFEKGLDRLSRPRAPGMGPGSSPGRRDRRGPRAQNPTNPIFSHTRRRGPIPDFRCRRSRWRAGRTAGAAVRTEAGPPSRGGRGDADGKPAGFLNKSQPNAAGMTHLQTAAAAPLQPGFPNFFASRQGDTINFQGVAAAQIFSTGSFCAAFTPSISGFQYLQYCRIYRVSGPVFRCIGMVRAALALRGDEG